VVRRSQVKALAIVMAGDTTRRGAKIALAPWVSASDCWLLGNVLESLALRLGLAAGIPSITIVTRTFD
jgi:hypothetical protein